MMFPRLLVLLMLFGVGGVRAMAQSTPEPMVVEPTVSREEADLIGRIVAMSATNRPAAIALLEEGRSAKSSAALDFTLGNLHFQDGTHDAAVNAYRDALAKLPTFRAARVNLARLYLLGEKPADALPVLREVATDGQADADTYLLLGHALLLTDALVSAETAYRQCLMLRPGDADALLGLARALLPQDRPRETLALAHELLRRDPMRREWWGLQANALMALDRPEEAARALESARRLDLADAEMLATLGDLHVNAGRAEDALAVYEAAFAGESPSANRMLRAIEGLLMTGHPGMAVRLRDRLAAIETTPEQRRTLLRLSGDLALNADDAEGALGYFAALLEDDPLDGRTLLRMAALHREVDRLEDALLFAERAARRPGVQVEALILQARIEVQRERYRSAVGLLEAAQALEPRDQVERYLHQIRRLAALKD
jgi:tetratricopeptide (TPR) repeat protein